MNARVRYVHNGSRELFFSITIVHKTIMKHLELLAVLVTPAARKAAAAAVTVRFLRNGQTGHWGDPAQDWPDAASNAVVYAVAIWAAYLNSPVPATLRGADKPEQE